MRYMAFSLHDTFKSLRDYSDEDLYQMLECNERIEMIRLGAISSEILRRQLAKDKEVIKVEEE